MHPLMTHINPSVRAALWVWALSRAGAWLLGGGVGAAALGGEGGPAWSWLCATLGGLEGAWGVWALIALGELAWGVGAASVYAFVRRDALPQTAERAAWLWGLSPLVCLATPTGSWALAACLVCAACAAARGGRHLLALGALGVAMGMRLELVVLAPAVAWAGAKAFEPGRHRPWAPWALGLGPWAMASAWVFAAVLSAGAAGASTRGLHGGWRGSLAMEWGWGSAPEVILAAWTLGFVALAVRFRGRTPGHWLALGAPALALPWIHAGVEAGAPAILAAPALFGLLGKATEDPSVERPILVGSVLLWAWGMGAF